MGLAPVPPKPHFLLLRHDIMTGPLQLLSLVLERYHARPMPREIWWSVAGITQSWLVLQCGVTTSTFAIHVRSASDNPEQCQPLLFHGYSHN